MKYNYLFKKYIFVFYLLINTFLSYSIIIFTSTENSFINKSNIYICDNNGKNKKIITDINSDLSFYNPDYSVKSKKIITKSYSSEGHKIITMDLDGKNIKTIFFDKNEFYDFPKFSPKNSDIILYIKGLKINNYKTYNLYLFDMKENISTRLTNMGYCNSPSWSNSGKKIVFVSNNEIYIIDKDGKNLEQLTNDDNIKINPAFINKDRYVYYSIVENKTNNKRILTMFKINLSKKRIYKQENIKGNYYSYVSYNKNQIIASGELADFTYGIFLIDFKLNKEMEIIRLISEPGYAFYIDDKLL